jgi:5-formyltetrahydrofolate cyclo-ligase
LRSKILIRQRFISKRLHFSSIYKLNAQKRINAHVENFVQKLGVYDVGIYYALKSEVTTRNIIGALLSLNFNISLPKVMDDNIMHFYKLSSLKEVQEGSYSKVSACNDICKPSLILTPLVAFDKHFNRLGYGKGYFDRYFADHPYTIKVGLAFSKQYYNGKFEIESHDIKLDYIIIETGVLTI